MRRRSILLVGVTLAILLIFSCIILNAPNYYHELHRVPSADLESQPEIILYNRTPSLRFSA